jgi:hypothetical protein
VVIVGAGESHPADDDDEQKLPDDERTGQPHGAPHPARRRNRFHIDGLYGTGSMEARFNAR